MMRLSRAIRPRTRKRRNGSGRRGAVIVEFAFTFMLFFVIVLTLMEIGRGIWTYTTLSHAARQTARFAQISGTITGVATLVELKQVADRWAHGLNPNDLTLNAQWYPIVPDAVNDPPTADPANAEREDIVEMQLLYDFKLISSPIILTYSTLTMSSTSRMIVSN